MPALASGLGAGRTERSAPDRPAGVPYGVAAYLSAGPLVADRLGAAAGRDVRLELSARETADGGRVSVARRLADGRTVGIEAVVD